MWDFFQGFWWIFGLIAVCFAVGHVADLIIANTTEAVTRSLKSQFSDLSRSLSNIEQRLAYLENAVSDLKPKPPREFTPPLRLGAMVLHENAPPR